MKVAILGPICKDEIIIKNKSSFLVGGLTYYTGNALFSLGEDVELFATFGNESDEFLKEIKPKINHILKENTIKFVNEYPSDDSNIRIQRAKFFENTITEEVIEKYDIDEFDFFILGPLSHENFSIDLFKLLAKKPGKVILAPQGLIRYLENDSVVWKNPENVLNVLKYVDYILMDDKELEFISSKKDMEKGVEVLKEKGAKNIIITKGKDGSCLFFDKKYDIKAIHTDKLVDPTGAGDSYLAGFVKAINLFSDPQKMGKYASAVATLAIQKEGPFSGSEEDVKKIII